MSVNAYANSAFETANSASSYANSGFTTANSAGVYANSAFLKANTPTHVANSAASYANSAFTTANTANSTVNTKVTINSLNFLSAPSANTQNTIFLVVDLDSGTATTKKMSLSVLTDRSANSAGSYANSAFSTANSAGGAAAASSYANSAFLTANTPNHVANSAASYANSGFALANTTITVGVYANSAFLTANTPNHTANSAASYANGAFLAANSAGGAAAAGSYANSAFVHANSAFSAANSAFIHANSSFGFANTAANLALSFSATTILDVSASGSSAYRFSQYGASNNPNVSTFSATTLGFNLSALAGSHPFHIRLGDNSADFNTGLVHVSTTGTLSYDLDAQGKTSGTVFWRIPSTSVGIYKYRCSAHPVAMIGDINIANTAGIYFAYST